MSFKQLPKAVKELRLHLCQNSAASAGVRRVPLYAPSGNGIMLEEAAQELLLEQFIKASYPELKKSNPDVKVLVREAQGVSPRAFVRFERGTEAQAALDDLSEKDVASALAKLAGAQ